MGLGLGAELVVGYAAMTEFVPPQARGKWVGALSVFVVTSLPFSALASTLIIPRSSWRAMFVLAGFGGLVVWYLRKALPESPRWLESMGRTEEAEAIMKSIEERSEEHTSELQSLAYLVCRLLLEKKKNQEKQYKNNNTSIHN